jgi:hypothetical protein
MNSARLDFRRFSKNWINFTYLKKPWLACGADDPGWAGHAGGNALARNMQLELNGRPLRLINKQTSFSHLVLILCLPG